MQEYHSRAVLELLSGCVWQGGVLQLTDPTGY